MGTHQVSTRGPCLCSCHSRTGLGFDQSPTPALAPRRPGLLLDPRLHSKPDSGLSLCPLPSPAQDLGPDLSSRHGPLRLGPCPCLESMSGSDWSVPLVLCQSSRPARVVGLCPGSRRRGLGPCWCSSSGPEAGTAPCWPLGLEATYPSPPVLEAALQWVEPLTLGLPHWRAHLMTSSSSWWLGNLRFLREHSGGPRT